MSAIVSKPEEVTVIAADDVDNQRKGESLRRLVSRGQGRFVFALVEFDLPSLQQEVLDKLRADLPDLNLVTVKLSPLPADASPELNVLDQLEDLVNLASPEKVPDALLITGYESLFADAIAKDGQPTESLKRAIQPLNLGRNVLAETFPCPVLLCLPPAAMGIFLQSAPDLVSWKSGFFKFESDPAAVRARLEEAAKAKISWWTRWRLRQSDPAELLAETKRLETLIADAEALPADNRLIAQLYHRLGWTAVALKDRMQARWAFAEMLRRAHEADDQQLISAAERGGRAAEAIISVARISSEQSTAVQQVFRGAAALTENEGLYGREDELRDLINRATFVGSRFLTVWGETGCGKTSLVLAGLLPELKRIGNYLPVVIRQWNDPEANIRQALEQSSGLSLESFSTLHDCIQHASQQTAKTVVVVCDQFEQFFTTHPQRSQRVSLIKAIGACVNDLRIPCKFIFIVREDQLGRIVEFESDVPEPLEQRKRFYLPLLNSAAAVRVLQLQADKAGLEWPEVFVRTVVNDLTQDGRARPIELQLVGEALAVSGIGNELDFARAGRARGLIADYLLLALDNLGQNKHLSQMIKRKLLAFLAYILPPFIRDRDKWDQRNYMERVLLTLTAEPAGRLALTPDNIALRTGIKLEIVLPVLELLIQSNLVRRTDGLLCAEQSTDATAVRYELTHDVLTNIMPTYWLENRRWVSSILARALDDVNPRPTISLDQCKVFNERSELQP